MKYDKEHGNAQYDYAYDNSELIENDEKKVKFMICLKNVIGHTATKVAEAGIQVGSQTRMPEFNKDLNMHNGFNAPNPFSTPSQNKVEKD